MKREGKHVREKSKYVILNIVALCLLICIIGRMAYAKYTSEIKQDTFNVEFIAGNIELTLSDSGNEFVMVPGKVITKDTKVTVKAKSEACYVFIKLENLDDFNKYFDYELTDGWKELVDNPEVYYCELPKTTIDTDIYIFNNNQIMVKESVTKQDLEELNGNNITLNFTAYAVQKTNEVSNETDAWELINNNNQAI